MVASVAWMFADGQSVVHNCDNIPTRWPNRFEFTFMPQ